MDKDFKNRQYRLKVPIIDKKNKSQALTRMGTLLYGQKQFQNISKQMSQLKIPQLAIKDGGVEVEKKYIESDVSIVGIMYMIFLLLTFVYIYASAWYKNKLSWKKGSITLSEALQYSERIGSTLLVVVMTSLLIGLLIDKGFVSEHASKLKRSLVSVAFIILAALLLLFLIPPHNRYMKPHVFLAVVFMTFLGYGTLIFTILYNDIYVRDGLIKSLTYTTYSLLGMLGILTIFGFSAVLFGFQYKNLSRFIGIGEIICLLLSIAIVGIVAFLPKLVDYEQLCIGLGFENKNKTN